MSINLAERNFFEWLQLNTDRYKTSENLNIEIIRESIRKLDIFVDLPTNIKFEDKTILCHDGHGLRLRCYEVTNTIRPLIIFLPGNGFLYDLFEANHSIISKIATKSGCHAVMVDYRLAPEYPYPNALEDAIEAVNFIFNNIKLFKADIKKIILAGYSSGANLAAVITNRIRYDSIRPIFHQFLISGAYDYTNSLHEYDEFSCQDKLLSPGEAQFSFDSYCNKSNRKEPSCSPFWEPDLSGLPPTTIMVAEYDGGRSQSEAYVLKLIEAKNKVTKIVLPGQTHGTILYRKALKDGKDPALVAAERILEII